MGRISCCRDEFIPAVGMWLPTHCLPTLDGNMAELRGQNVAASGEEDARVSYTETVRANEARPFHQLPDPCSRGRTLTGVSPQGAIPAAHMKEAPKVPGVTIDHFRRAATDIGANGDNDTLPFDIDCRLIRDEAEGLAQAANAFFSHLDGLPKREVVDRINSLSVFSERIMVPTGSAGFRITTKIHPFWNLYFNGLGVAVAERNEPLRSARAHSYRFVTGQDHLFDRARSWRAYREATLADETLARAEGYVVQTDVSSFYEHVYHHRLENQLDDLFLHQSTLPAQVDRFLSKFAAGRSFGLPVGGQCARILAEVMMADVDQALSDASLVWTGT